MLNETFDLAIQYLNNGSLLEATTSVYEAALPGGWFYLAILMFIAVLVYLKTENLGLIGFIVGGVSWYLLELGKLDAVYQFIPYTIMALSFGLTIYLFYTERQGG